MTTCVHLQGWATASVAASGWIVLARHCSGCLMWASCLYSGHVRACPEHKLEMRYTFPHALEAGVPHSCSF